MIEKHVVKAGEVYVFRRPRSRYWQCSSFLAGRNYRKSTKEESLALAKDFAEDWYLELRGKNHAGEIKAGKTFKQAADQFRLEYETITAGERSPKYVSLMGDRIRVHLLPFFGDKVVTEITPGMVQEYRVHRATSRTDKEGKPLKPARSTLHQEIVTLRHILKTANRHGWLPYLPDLSAPYKASGKEQEQIAYEIAAAVTGVFAVAVFTSAMEVIQAGQCLGKGRKERCTPLRKEAATVMSRWLRERNGQPEDAAFPNARGGSLSRDGVEYLLGRYAITAIKQCPSLKKKRVSPHVLRHTAAMELLQAGVDRAVIALWLGHATLNTVQAYLHADIKLKEQALAKTAPVGAKAGRYQPGDRLLDFLKRL